MHFPFSESTVIIHNRVGNIYPLLCLSLYNKEYNVIDIFSLSNTSCNNIIMNYDVVVFLTVLVIMHE